MRTKAAVMAPSEGLDPRSNSGWLSGNEHRLAYQILYRLLVMIGKIPLDSPHSLVHVDGAGARPDRLTGQSVRVTMSLKFVRETVYRNRHGVVPGRPDRGQRRIDGSSGRRGPWD